MLRPHCAFHTRNVTYTQSATSERVASKIRLDPIFSPWLIKYGGKSGFFLSNSVHPLQRPHKSYAVTKRDQQYILSLGLSQELNRDPLHPQTLNGALQLTTVCLLLGNVALLVL